MRLVGVLVSLLGFISFQSSAQQLIINEVSQGTGSAEYVELLVIGTPTCTAPIPCMDLRGIVLDDNNSYFGPGGIASGAIRFANNAFWSCIPQGTIILIYNESDRNGAIPPNDLSMNDGNCRLIIPVNSNLFEGQTISPNSSGNSSYPANVSWIAGSGSWNSVSMNNSNDSFLILSSISATVPSHAVSYGNNSNNSIIYFSGVAGGKVFSMTNNTDNNPATQANWTSGNVGTNETPGAPNNAANSAWIASMNPTCGVATNPLQATATSTPTGCSNPCTGTAAVTVSGGTAPYTYSWSNGATTSNLTALCGGTYTVTVTDAAGCTTTAQTTIASGGNLTVNVTVASETCQGACDGNVTAVASGGTPPYSYQWNDNSSQATLDNLCPATYTVTVTDQNNCSGTSSGTILAGTTIQSATINTTGPFTTNDAPIQFTAASAGGTWTADCATCISTTGVFNPQNAGAGTYEICYTIGSGACASQDCQTIVVTGCTAQNTTQTETICPGDSFQFNGQTLSNAGTYPVVFPGQNGCDSTHTLTLSLYQVVQQTATINPCMGDSVELQGTWYTTSDNVVFATTDANGCATTQTTHIVFEDCSIEDFAVFIPNVFTPNGDNVNDTFTFQIMGGLLSEGFIVNRWGNIIKQFEVDDLNWDGKTKEGFPVPDGVYTYVIVAKKNEGGKERYAGSVSVFR